MKLKRSRKERICRGCNAAIAKGDQYGQKAIRLTGKATQEERDAVRPAILIESISIQSDFCSACSERINQFN